MNLCRPFLSFALAALLPAFAQPPQPAELLPRETADGVVFSCLAPDATRVFLAGDFNAFARNRGGQVTDSRFAMTGPDRNGVFRKTVPLPPGLYRYKFAIEGSNSWTWIAPDYALHRDQEGNAYLVVDGQADSDPPAASARAAHTAEGLVHFELFAPDAILVYLAGSFNNWADNRDGRVIDLRFAMRGPDANGIWRASLPLPRGRHAYQFVLDGSTWISDPNAPVSPPDHHSFVEVP